MEKNPVITLGALICVGLIVLGIAIKSGLNSFSDKERIITVKGLAEELIKAEIATITFRSSYSSDNPNTALKLLNNEMSILKNIFESKGYKDIKIGKLNYYDSKTYYESKYVDDRLTRVKKDRYTLSNSVEISVKDVENAENIKQELTMDLISQEISADIHCVYTFPALNSIKPELIAKSTKNARTAGVQFANDSRSKLGKIKTASQGQISIVGQYYYGDFDDAGSRELPKEPYYERVRVVSTIVFFLED
jgi:hypothetical protein